MDSFIIEIANTPFAVQCSFGSTREYFRRYLSEKEAVFSVQTQPEDLIAEQNLLDEEADQEGLRRRVFTDPFLERAVIQRKVAEGMLSRDVLLLHGSTVAVDGKAYLFTARCGVGKSTHTRLWRQLFGDRAVMVNDDRAFLCVSTEGVVACGSPWSGKHGIDTNICVPLAGICILERGKVNHIQLISAAEALPELLHQAFVPSQQGNAQVESLTHRLADSVLLWQMACTKDPDAARVAYEAMSGGAHER